jgi:hypothetical protein
MASFKDKISLLIEKQAPEFVLNDHPKFLEFVKTYYTFMESAELAVTSIESTDGIRLETETAQENNLVLDASRLDTDRTQLDAGDKIILEDSSFGKFTRGETITGATSKATATVLAEDLTNGRLFISAQDKFTMNEIVTGGTSGAQAVINNYKPNPVTNIQELLNFRDPDKAISNFLTKFRNEFLNTLPETLASGLDKRNLIKNVRTLYRTKGTNRGHELFFRLLFNETSETIYPREQMLRASDGQFDTKKIMRAIQSTAQSLTGDTADLIGRTITGETSEATAIIENVFKFQIGENLVTEFILNEDTITGTFQTDEVVRGTETDESDVFIKATVTGIPNVISITNDGALYTTGEALGITGGGSGASINIDDIGRGAITQIFVDSAGSGYEIGDDIVFTNTDTGGGSAQAKVSLVNGGIVADEGTSDMTEGVDHIILEDETQRGDPFTGNKIVQESGTGSGDVTDIRIINGGNNYGSLPTATISTGSGGSGASIKLFGPEIGRVQSLKIIESGAEHQQSPSPPTLSMNGKFIVTGVSGTFTTSDTITGISDDGSTTVSGTFVSLDSDRGLMTLSDLTGNFGTGVTITGSGSEATATVQAGSLATATTTVSAVATTSGTFLNEDGHISETTMRIQDSLYYQDYSYVIKVGRSIADWRDSFKKTMHGAGFYFTGQVNIATQVDNKIRSFTGINSSIDYDGVALVINTLFSTIFGRRLGTETDGTSLRASPQVGVDPDFNDSTTEHFTTNTRDVTLKQAISLKFSSAQKHTIRDNSTRFGVVVAGPRMRSINKYWYTYSGSDNPQTSAAGADSVVRSYIQPLTLADWNQHRVIGTNLDSVDGTIVQFREINTPTLKTYLAFPTEITISYS